MPLLPEPALERLAVEQTDALMKRFVVGKTTYDQGATSFEWNGHLRRYVFRRRMVVWRDLGQVEIVLSDDGKRIRSFRDERRFLGAKHKPLKKADLVAIAKTTGLVGDSPMVSNIKAGDLYEFLLSQSDPGLPLRIQFTVNPAKKQVAALEVLED